MNELTYKTERDSQTERRLVAAVREEERGGWLGLADVKSFSRVRLFVTPWTVVYQAPPSTRYSRQEYWSGLPLPSPRCKLLHMKWINNKVLLYSTENNIQYPMINHNGKEYKKNVCVITESLCSTAEINTTL